MNVKELEKQVRSLPPQHLKRFSQWFDDYRQQSEAAASVDSENDLTAEQREEILRRRAAYLANPTTATPWEGTAERLIKQLRVRRRQKTPARRS